MTTLRHTVLAGIASQLDQAAAQARAVPQLKDALSLDEAYHVQRMSIGYRYARGERRVGIKMGFTSRAKMVQMGVHDLIWGRLTEGMRIDDAATIDKAAYVHPRVEPEIAFLMKKSLNGPVSLVEAQAAVEAVAPAIEVIDSRYRDFKFSLSDVVADNSSSSGFVLGRWAPADTDVSNLGMVLRADGRVAEVGSSAAVLGNPLRSLVAAARIAAAANEPLRPGDIVLAGGATAAIALAPLRHVRLEVERLGNVDLFCRI